ncbi:MAG: hypothetical protein IJS60_04120 [Abditibacteriota bacterium]|nr:hypothetical protein [Abditibacteriota bacterium]
MKNYLKYLLILIIILISFSLSFSQDAKKEKAKIKVTADNTSIPWGETGKNITLKGNVNIVYENYKLMSAYVIFNTETKFADSPGKISVVSEKADFTADKGNTNFKDRICRAQGHIQGFIKKEVAKDIKNEKRKENVQKEITENIKFWCDSGEYNYKTKILSAKGNIKISEKDRVITCDTLKYDANTEIFYLNGNVRGEDKEGQIFMSPGEVIVSVKEGNEYIKAPQVQSTFYVDLDDEEE